MSHAASSIVQTGSAISARNGSVSDDAHGCSTPKANGFGADEGGYEANGTAPITAFTSTKSERVARIASGSRRNEELHQAFLTWTRTCAVRSDPRYRPRMTEPEKPATGTSFGNGVSRLTRRS